MLVNPFECVPVPGTNVVPDPCGVVGHSFEDPKKHGRIWTVDSVFAPFPWRALGGIRCKIIDNAGFMSFINQRDLELLLDIASPGETIPWMDGVYPGLNDEDDGWYGICCDSEDLLDDLHYHELLLRQKFAELGHIPEGQEYRRKVQREENSFYEETLLFLWDGDPDVGEGPDGRRETLEKRWVPSESGEVLWKLGA